MTMKRNDFERFVRTNGETDRINKFSFELLRDKEFRKSIRKMWAGKFGKPLDFLYYDFIGMNWKDEILLSNLNEFLNIYMGQPGTFDFKLNIPGYSYFRISTTNEVDKNEKPKKYTMIAYTKDGHKVCRKSASKLYIEAYRNQSRLLKRTIPDKVLNRAAELFSIQWEAFVKTYDYYLNIDTNFVGIYEARGFGSCMTGEGNYTMFEGHHTMEEARACYLTNRAGDIVARAILWTNAKDEKGKSYRLLDRCYSLNSNVSLQQVLIGRCKEAGVIDLYKPAGCSCHDQKNIKTLDGSDFTGRLYTYIDIDNGDRVSYMDTFVWYNQDEKKAYNYECDNYTHELDTTAGVLFCGVYSEYYNREIDEEVAVWSCDVDSYIDCNDEEFVYIEGEYYLTSNCFYAIDTGNYFKDTDEIFYAEDTNKWYENNDNLVYSDESCCYYTIENCFFSKKRNIWIFDEEAIYIEEDDYDFINNKDEYYFYNGTYHIKEEVLNESV